MAQTVGYLQRLQANGVDFHSYTEEYLATDNELVRNVFGYPLAATVPDPCIPSCYVLGDDSNQVESLAAGYGPGSAARWLAVTAVLGLLVDRGVPGLGHRVHLLGMTDFNAVFVEAAAA